MGGDDVPQHAWGGPDHPGCCRDSEWPAAVAITVTVSEAILYFTDFFGLFLSFNSFFYEAYISTIGKSNECIRELEPSCGYESLTRFWSLILFQIQTPSHQLGSGIFCNFLYCSESQFHLL